MSKCWKYGEKKTILKAVRGKWQLIYKGKNSRIAPGFSQATLKAKNAWNEIYKYPKQITVSHECYIQQNYLLELMEK